MKHLTRLEHLTNTFDTIEKCIKQSMFTMVFKRRYENVKTMYKHTILTYSRTENIKCLQGKFMWKLLDKKQTEHSNYHCTTMRK